MKKMLIIMGHPSKESLSESLAIAYLEGAKHSGYYIELLRIRDLKFDPNLGEGYKSRENMELEPDLHIAQQKISQAEHIVFIYPTWWGSMPALTKGFIDKVFQPGFAFKYKKGKNFPEKLMAGKSMRVICTMDTPKWYFYLFQQSGQYKTLKHLVFGFVGFKPLRFTTIGNVRSLSKVEIQKHLTSIHKLGGNGQ